MADWILYLFVRLEAFVFRLLPLKLSLWIARRFGSLIYYTMGRRKTVAYANLRAAFRGRYTPSQANRIIKEIYQNLAQSYIELLKFPQFDEDYVSKYIRVEGLDKVRSAAKEEDRGVIFLTAHFGNWELCSLTGSTFGFKMNVLVRFQKLKRLNDYLNKMRGSKGANVIFKDDAIEEITDALRRKETVGILSDQDGGKRGEFVDFLGRPASTPKGAANFSLRTGASIFPVVIIRQKGPYHTVMIEDDISVLQSEDIKKDIHEILQRFANKLAGYIEKYPGQWLWLHKRWKSTPARYVLVLSDGRAGHLKQSRALANKIRKARVERGFSAEDTAIETLEVKFRSGLARTVFDIGSLLGMGLHSLSFCFPEEVYANLRAAYADYVVSCGASLAGVNLAFKRELGSKAVVIMKPNMYNIKDFSLSVIPVHDKAGDYGNAVFTKGAVTDLDKNSLREYGEKLKRHAVVNRGRVIGVLLGGDSKSYAFEKELAVEVVDRVMEAAGDIEADVLITTSRRTPRAVEFALKERYGKSERVKLLLIANDNNFEGAVEGILALSDVIVVSGESVAMVTEAVSSGKPVAVFMPQKINKFSGTKQEVSVRNLEKEGLLAVSAPADISGDIKHLINHKQADILSGDMGAIRAGLDKIL
ncbi:MAG: ELM1/GtrOC1 family putative glycosyltransferase [Candidatus Omnitrophica bacterium]|nr:ELM1/GtrOC1 family putative glycosyltransferase [Candidatus Omnitrophota bacterium]MDD5310829.1 ELM1/GtrOC1 family putative glycosyltransferase [Candidatus Omnitrophota bacterium]